MNRLFAPVVVLISLVAIVLGVITLVDSTVATGGFLALGAIVLGCTGLVLAVLVELVAGRR